MNRIFFALLAGVLAACNPMATNINDYDYSIWGEEEQLARHCGREVKKNHHFRKNSGFALQDFSRYVADCVSKLKRQKRNVGQDWNNPRVSAFMGPDGKKTYQATCNFNNEVACYRAASSACGGKPYNIVRYEFWGNGIKASRTGDNIGSQNNININVGYGNQIYANSSKKPEYIRSTWQCR